MRMKRNLKAIPVLVAGLFTSQLSIAAGSVSADPHMRARHVCHADASR